jgi:membrane protein
MIQKLYSLIFDSKAYKKIFDKVQKITIGRQKISLYRTIQIFLTQLRKDNITERASAMAFNFVLSMFPAVIFLFTLIPYVPIENLQERIMTSLQNMLPTSIYAGAASAIYDIIHIPHGGLLSFGFLFALFAATNGIMSMISAFNKCYKTAEKRGYFKTIFTAAGIVFLLIIVIFISIFFAVFSRHIINQINFGQVFLLYFIICFKYLLFFAVFFIGISVIYYMAPAMTVRWKFFSPGSFIASLLSIFFTLGFGFYVNSFDSYNKLYGSLGAFIGVMLWFYAISIVLLIGFEINASIDLAKREMYKKAQE